MAGTDLKRAYLASGLRGVTAQNVFTNRLDEAEAFVRSADGLLREARESPSWVEDPGRPRRNVLVFYGMGGVGKSSLSREIESRFLAGTLPAGSGKRTAIRVDFDDPGCRDILSVVLRLRAGLADAAARWPAFDLVLASYWERARPGEPLRQFLRQSGLLQRLGTNLGLAEQVEAVIDDLVDVSGVIGTTRKAVRHVNAAIREAHDRKNLLADCPLFGAFLDAEADDELISFMPYLLGWHLERLQRDSGHTVTVFLDTWERVQAQADRVLESQLMRMVHAMPNVLFVITGRSRLDWGNDEAQGSLELAGRACWPGLALQADDEEPRQHLVGFLSPEDCRSYLTASLRLGDRAVLSTEVQDAIVKASEGLPLYLDVAVDVAAQELGRGGRLGPWLYEEPLPGLVTRVMRGLSRPEQDLARAAALLGGFDTALLQAAVPEAGDNDVQRFLRRSFVQTRPDHWMPYGMHDVLREAVRSRDEETGWAWSEERWRRSARAALDEMATRAHGLSATTADNESLIECLVRGIDLADAAAHLPDWTAELAVTALTANLWSPLTRLAGAQRDYPPVQALVDGLQGAGLVWTGEAAEADRLLASALRETQLPTQVRAALQAEQGYALRLLGRPDDAEMVYREAAMASGRVGQRARRLVAYMQQMRGNFPQARDGYLSLQLADEAEELERQCNLGGVHLNNALFEISARHYRHAELLADRVGSLSLSARVAVYLAETLSWGGGARAVGQAETAIELTRAAGLPSELARAHAARAVATVGNVVPNGVRSDLALGLASGPTDGGLAAEVFCSLVLGELPAAEDGVRRLVRMTDDAGGFRWRLLVVQWWLDPQADVAATSAAAGVRWLDDVDGVAERWRSVLQLRRE